jgi:hypothetical protein
MHQDYFEEHWRGIRGRPDGVITKPRIEGRQVDRVIEQSVDRVLEGAKEELRMRRIHLLFIESLASSLRVR